LDNLKGEFEVKESLLQKYYHLGRNLMPKFKSVQIEHILHEHNVRGDMLLRLATIKKKGLHRPVIYINLKNPSFSTDEYLAIDEKETWITPIKCFLGNGECRAQEKKTMRQQTAWFIFIGSDLYRQGYTWPY